jgi:hypothetical protein
MGNHYMFPAGMRAALFELWHLMMFAVLTDMLNDEDIAPFFFQVAHAMVAPPRMLWLPRQHRTVNSFTDDECLTNFRYNFGSDVTRLISLFGVPATFKKKNGGIVTGEEAMLILLARFAYPARWTALVYIFGGSPGFLSETMYLVLHWLYEHAADTLLNNFSRYSTFFAGWAAAIARKRGSYSGGVAMFIDGTLRKMCRPSRLQQECYSGHKRTHGLKYQSVSAPCGLILDLFGPVSGRRHDMYLLRESRVLHRLHMACTLLGEIFRIYGDPAYPIHALLLRAFRGNNLTAAQEQFNKELNAARTSVEWAFGKVVKYMAQLDFKAAMKLHEAPLGKFYKLAVILTNCHTCTYKSSVTGSFFECDPPSLEVYLRGLDGHGPWAP